MISLLRSSAYLGIAQRVETVVRESVCKWEPQDHRQPRPRSHLHTVAVTERGREEVQAVRRRDVGGRGVLDQRAGPNIHSTGRRELTEFVKGKEETKIHPTVLCISVLMQMPRQFNFFPCFTVQICSSL